MTQSTTKDGFGAFDAVFVISLARFANRRRRILEQLNQFSIANLEIVDAVDGRELDVEQLKLDHKLKCNPDTGKWLSPGEVGCLMSHRNLWNRIISEKLNQVLILEDDVLLAKNADSYLQVLLSNLPNDWDILHLHSHFGVGSGERNDPGRVRINEHLWRGYQEGGGTAAYALSNRNRAADYLYNISSPMTYAADGYVNWLTADWDNRNWKGYIAHPFICSIAEGKSAIWHKSEHEHATWLGNLKTFIKNLSAKFYR